jgi:hypothetical protein
MEVPKRTCAGPSVITAAAGVPALAIPEGPWDCDGNAIPDEDQDGGFSP